jgi:hypothetical protein
MVRAASVALLLGLGLSLVGACSGKFEGDESGDGGESGAAKPPVKTPPKPSPLKACQTYASTWCVKAFGCFVQVGRLDEASLQFNVDECTKVIIETLPCSAATSVGGEYDKCLTSVKGMACSKWDVPQTQFATVIPPTSCDEVVLFE